MRLVDHQPDARVGDGLVADADHQVVRQAVRLELLAERVRRPRNGEAGTLDVVDVGDVIERHRLDADLQRRSGDHATSAIGALIPRGSAT